MKEHSMKEFIELVREMRSAQKEFFKQRGVNPIRAKEALSQSKDLENKVDNKIIELTNTQTELF